MTMQGWQTVINEFAKTLITLSTAVLAASITIAGNFFEPGSFEFYAIGAAWLFLFLSIVSSLFSITKLINHLKISNDTTEKNRTIFGANMSYIMFGLAGLSFLVAGGFVVFGQSTDHELTEEQALNMAESALLREGYGESREWQLAYLAPRLPKDGFVMLFRRNDSMKRLAIAVVPEEDGNTLALVEGE